ncbi:hypothetical protein BU23DRAFT_582664 [Bimuria novae-zelandiae CBS 107.79]|uniref:Uncharacterized protein n=1 Tax=Bimuria novae-zelandiae CBS 107.79 TaxID=1447943 RepID=A0A6A5UW94_9PLEO|nr:hypothetical protein BU23DRAFT_582664 [Bimuria novae-zelandiae CBS 107.79]
MDEKGFLIGIIGRSKRVFSRRMWEKKEKAWASSLQEETILKSFEATSILPFNLEVILKRFAKTTQDEQESRESSTLVLSGSDWRKLDRLVRAVTAELRKAAKLYKEKIAEEKRVGREAAKVAREKERAKKAAERARQKEAPSQPPTQSNKRQKRVVDAVATKEALSAVLVALPKTTRRGRNVKLLSKYK